MGAQYNVYHLVNLQTNTDIGIPASSACVIKFRVTKKAYLRQKQESLRSNSTTYLAFHQFKTFCTHKMKM